MSIPVAAKQSFVLFPLAGKQFALSADDVVELFRSGSVQNFPHTTPSLSGVLVHRGEILPVWDVAPVLVGENNPTRIFYLVVRCNIGGEERNALQVHGECQILHTEMLPPREVSPPYVRGLLVLGERYVEVLDLERLGTTVAAPESAPEHEGVVA